MTDVVLTDGSRAVVDDADAWMLEGLVWRRHSKGYVCASWGTDVTILLHRLIMDPPDELVVDHKDGDPSNNRRSNLRVVTQVANGHNRTKLNRNNTSGHRGVCWVARSRRWKAAIGVNGETILLGYFEDLDDAINARRAGEEYYRPHTIPI